ncbi:MAG TPA: hypothetical protein VGL07_16975 [Buttiauxella sp.]|jgi:hypothetical protein
MEQRLIDKLSLIQMIECESVKNFEVRKDLSTDKYALYCKSANKDDLELVAKETRGGIKYWTTSDGCLRYCAEIGLESVTLVFIPAHAASTFILTMEAADDAIQTL